FHANAMNLDFPASIPLPHVGPDHLRAQRSSANRQRSHRPTYQTNTGAALILSLFSAAAGRSYVVSPTFEVAIGSETQKLHHTTSVILRLPDPPAVLLGRSKVSRFQLARAASY